MSFFSKSVSKKKKKSINNGIPIKTKSKTRITAKNTYFFCLVSVSFKKRFVEVQFPRTKIYPFKVYNLMGLANM